MTILRIRCLTCNDERYIKDEYGNQACPDCCCQNCSEPVEKLLDQQDLIGFLNYQIKILKEQLNIATDLGDKRWQALNVIYEYAGLGNYNIDWCKKKAASGMGLKDKVNNDGA